MLRDSSWHTYRSNQDLWLDRTSAQMETKPSGSASSPHSRECSSPAVKLVVDVIFADNELLPCFRLFNLATEISRALSLVARIYSDWVNMFPPGATVPARRDYPPPEQIRPQAWKSASLTGVNKGSGPLRSTAQGSNPTEYVHRTGGARNSQVHTKYIRSQSMEYESAWSLCYPFRLSVHKRQASCDMA